MTDTTPATTVIAEHELPAPPDEVWDLLTTDDGFATWSGAGSTIDPQPGGFLSTPDTATGIERVGAVEQANAPQHLRYRWWPTDDPDLVSTVDLVLTPIPTGTRLVITEHLVAAPVASASVAPRNATMAATTTTFTPTLLARSTPALATCVAAAR